MSLDPLLDKVQEEYRWTTDGPYEHALEDALEAALSLLGVTRNPWFQNPN